MDLLYINAYLVTRHYAGPEEGGWYYNAGEPLASVPINAMRVIGHKHCWQCEKARNNEGEFCRINDSGPYDDQDDEYYEEEIFDPETKIIQHLIPADSSIKDSIIKDLENKFRDLNEGDIYSVRGGQVVEVSVATHMARPWPDKKPRYE